MSVSFSKDLKWEERINAERNHERQFKTNCAVCFPGWEKKIITHILTGKRVPRGLFRARFIGGFDKDLLAVFTPLMLFS